MIYFRSGIIAPIYKVIFLGLIFFSLIIFKGETIVLAQERSPDLIRLETDMLEARYLASKRDDTKKALIANYETLMPQVCVSSQEKPEYISEQCQGLIDKTILLDESNARAICFRDGFSSELCMELSQTTNAKGVGQSPYEKLKKMLDAPPQSPVRPRDGKLDPEREEIKRLSDELLRASLQYKQEQTPDRKNKVLNIYSRLIPIVCKVKPNEEYIPNTECMNHTEQSLMIEPSFRIGLCYKEGPNSEHCTGLPIGQNQPARPAQPRSENNKGFIEF